MKPNVYTNQTHILSLGCVFIRRYIIVLKLLLLIRIYKKKIIESYVRYSYLKSYDIPEKTLIFLHVNRFNVR